MTLEIVAGIQHEIAEMRSKYVIFQSKKELLIDIQKLCDVLRKELQKKPEENVLRLATIMNDCATVGFTDGVLSIWKMTAESIGLWPHKEALELLIRSELSSKENNVYSVVCLWDESIYGEFSIFLAEFIKTAEKQYDQDTSERAVALWRSMCVTDRRKVST